MILGPFAEVHVGLPAGLQHRFLIASRDSVKGPTCKCFGIHPNSGLLKIFRPTLHLLARSGVTLPEGSHTVALWVLAPQRPKHSQLCINSRRVPYLDLLGSK